MLLNNKILIVDDNPNIHQDFKNALGNRETRKFGKVIELEKEIFGKSTGHYQSFINFNLHHAFSAENSFQILEDLKDDENPIALVFMDIKMPDGLDGISASKEILQKYPNTEIVLCTAFTDYSHEEIIEKLGLSDHVLFLKKPFDIVEVRQLAIALIQKWNLNKEVERYTNKLEIEVKKRTIELENALVDVKRANVAKSNFLSLMSHEIRNPINSIVGLMDLIKKCNDKEDKENYILLAHKASGTLLSLVNDVLDLSKIEANQLSIENSEINLLQLLENISADFTVPIYEKGLEFNLLMPLKFPENIYGDSSRIRQILVNYISNAVKFTPTGNITLTVEFNRLSNNKAEFVFNVTDTGIGIADNDQKKLFTDYSQISDGLPYNKLGTGLGLSISKKLANLMGGDVNVRSKKAVGSTFSLQLPLNVSKEDSTNQEQIKILPDTTILLISNSETTKKFFKYYTKELNIDKSLRILDQINDIFIFKSKQTQLLERIKVFFDIENPIPENLLNELNLITRKKMDVHSITPYLYKPKINYQSIFTITNISRPLHPKDLIKLLSSEDSALPINKSIPIATNNKELEDKIKKCRILLVDDDPMALLITATNLKNYGFNVDKAESGDLVLSYHKHNNYDIIFMDLMLNGANGIDTTQRIRNLSAPYSNVHIIALTANSFIEDKERCLNGGINDFLTKPVSPKTLYDKITNFLLQRNDATSISENVPNYITPKESELLLTIEAYLKNTYEFKNEQILKILQVSKTAISDTLNEIDQAIKNRNFSLLKILFHRIKGSLKNLGLIEPAEWAKEIEISIEDQTQTKTAEETCQRLRIYLQSILPK